MDWSNEERTKLFDKWGQSHGEADDIIALASLSVELAAARGGTMTVGEVAELAKSGLDEDMRVVAHISALGARNAVLEAQLALEIRQTKAVAEALAASANDMTLLRERLSAAEDGNRELVIRAQQAEALLEREQDAARLWSKRAIAAVEERDELKAQLSDARIARDTQEMVDLGIIGRLEARCATLSAAGQVLSAHVDSTGAPEEEVSGLCERSHGPSEVCGNCDPRDMPEREPHEFKPGHGTRDACRYASLVNGQLCGWEQSAHRYPCSATCTHDDAATPGHPERVKELNDAVTREVNAFVGETLGARRALCDAMERLGFDGAAMFRDTSLDTSALGNALFQSVRDEEERVATGAAEAMRAACLDAAISSVKTSLGVSDGDPALDALKSAIEGAAP